MLELETDTVEYTDRKGNTVKLTVTEADVERGTLRFSISDQMTKVVADAKEAGHPYSEEAAYDLTRVYPNLVASVTSVEGLNWPPTPEEFLRLPENFWDKWSAVVNRLNPHWFPKRQEPPKTPEQAKAAEEEKKEPSGEPPTPISA
jgi:hypothetical protein